MTATTTIRTAELEALDRAIAVAESRVRERDAERGRAVREAERAAEPLRAYRVAVGAGEIEADADREAALEAEVARARSGLATRAVLTGGRVSDRVLVDERAEALHEGAIEARRAAVREREQFLRRHRDELTAEALAETVAAAGRLADLHAEVRAAGGAYNEATRRLYALDYGPDLPEDPAVDGGEVARLRAFAEGSS